MTSVPFLPQSIALVFLTLLAWAAISDIRTYRIPNVIPVCLVALYPLHLLASAVMPDWIGGLLVALAVFAAGFGLFAAGLLGGGDVKLLGAVALWAGPSQLLSFLVLTALAGGVLGLMFWLPRMAQGWLASVTAWITPPSKGHPPVPYGVAIAAGAGLIGVPLITG